jgi:sec-independent protein translocase protein TatA
MFGLEPWHVVLLLGVVLVVFGPKRLPEIGKSLGESIREFRKATSEFGDVVKTAASAPSSAALTPPAAGTLTPSSNVDPVLVGSPVPGHEAGKSPSSPGQP